MGPLFAATIALAAITLSFFSDGHADDVCTTEVREAACRQDDAIMANRKAQEALGILKSSPESGQPEPLEIP
ncbi:MAG TPA: hypothetical protein VJX92_27210 [Methylomirabilota bacterium]|nr:hypothetical protein [Methylomirabilota bacterium]